MLIRTLTLTVCLLFSITSNASIWPFSNDGDDALMKTCPNCVEVAKEVESLQAITCPADQFPNGVMDIVHSPRFFPTLLLLRNTDMGAYDAALDKVKNNIGCSAYQSTLERVKSFWGELSNTIPSFSIK
ncbi:hypothetical protein ACRTC3_11715 [Photobacterium damselae]|uniref:hypothetical protein n=1 Tax=Photobacterium damselae TaxID=38293 RepID=UPI003D7F13B4